MMMAVKRCLHFSGHTEKRYEHKWYITQDEWYEHEPESVLKNKDYKILLDFSIQTDHVIEARR